MFVSLYFIESEEFGMKRRFIGVAIAGFAIFLTLFSPIKASANNPQIPINAVIYPIYKPDFDSPGLCSQSSVTVSRNDGLPFSGNGDRIEIQLKAKESSLLSSLTSASKSIIQDIYTNLEVTSVSVPISLCVRDISGPYVTGEITEIEVVIVYKKGYTIIAGGFSAKVKLLPKTPEAQAIEKLIKDCNFQFKPNWLAPIVQVKKDVPKGKPVTLAGTFFRNGIPSPGDTLRIYEDFNTDPTRGNVKLLSESKTDQNGVFSFTFVPKSKNGIFTVTFQARTSPLGPLSGPFESGSFIVSVDCKTNCNYRPSITDWVLAHSDTCLSAFQKYDVDFASRSDSSLMYPNREGRIPFLFKKVFPGSSNKKSYFNASEADYGGYSSSTSSSGSGTKRCYVSGYTTKTGKRVSGYWRSC
jgi:hypothetical protein